MSTSRLPQLVSIALLALPFAACSEQAADDVDARGPGFTGGKADDAFTSGPLYLTGAFDGSRSIRMWIETMDFARQLSRETNKRLRWSYFINTAYYFTNITGSEIGTASSQNDAKIRWAITQQAINEGHEIGNHTVRHKNGANWSRDQWQREIDEVHAAVESHLFQPVLGADGKPLFPRWRPASGAAAGAVGASCATASQCGTGSCYKVTPDQGFCTRSCSSDAACASGTVCAGVCLPLPELPVVDRDGQVLFDAQGRPNLGNSKLKPYRMVGFRAPQLGHNANLFDVLAARGYRYDTSKILPPGPPARTVHQGRTFESLFQFALMRHPGAASIPMDYNYYVSDVSGARMASDYKAAIRRHYEQLDRVPWNIGHHFSLWKDGAYWQAMKDAFRYAAQGCPEQGVRRCPDVAFVTFEQLADRLDGKTDGGEDIFANPNVVEDDTEHVAETCEEHLED
jgi:peptidoglycan/xylan/chitin deacetylase (PgdA/CDA1 family)